MMIVSTSGQSGLSRVIIDLVADVIFFRSNNNKLYMCVCDDLRDCFCV